MQIVRVTTAVAVRVEMFTTEEEQALVGFLAGYGALTREAYQLDLRQWVQWCAERQVALFGARRADIEGFGRHLEACGEPARPSPAGCALSPASTATPKRKASSRTRPRCTFADRGSTTSRTRPAWTGMRSEQCWWRPDSAERKSTR